MTTTNYAGWITGAGFDDDCDAGARALPKRRVRPELAEETIRHLDRLVHTIEGEIVPRLMLARSAAQPLAAAAPEVGRPDPADVARFVGLLMQADPAPSISFVDDLRRAAVPSDRLYLGLLAPAARSLGVMWEEDRCDFTEVTVGLFRLHQLLSHVDERYGQELAGADEGRRALLAPMPGEQHLFGLWIVGEFLRRGGWSVRGLAPDSADAIVERVRGEHFAVVGLSIACDRHLDPLAQVIQRIRRASRNRALGIMVGGPLVLRRPELVGLVGADATATDARQAVAQADRMYRLLATAG